MPLYEYRCHGCGKTFEVLQKFSDEPLTKHEECGGEVERLISAPALQFKGTGWYVTDYARSGSNGGGKSESKPSSGSESAGAAKTESKSDSSKAANKPAATE
ncbi:MAG TPA: FmdB family zinc ribbon protein [Verrucomicrobiae bacterium]|nr:FmdB family zinc ribbon protein [Verrucomicrobiae bacterium]